MIPLTNSFQGQVVQLESDNTTTVALINTEWCWILVLETEIAAGIRLGHTAPGDLDNNQSCRCG